MRRCPTCGARQRGEPSCHRCQTDLRQVLAVEGAGARYRRQASAALEVGRRQEARALADRACALHRSRASIALRAVVALSDGDFDLALRLWREVQKGRNT